MKTIVRQGAITHQLELSAQPLGACFSVPASSFADHRSRPGRLQQQGDAEHGGPAFAPAEGGTRVRVLQHELTEAVPRVSARREREDPYADRSASLCAARVTGRSARSASACCSIVP